MLNPANSRADPSLAGALELKPHELQALRFLGAGPHLMTEIADENALAAFMTLDDLARRGLVHCTPGDGQTRGPEFRLTIEGVDALIAMDGAV